jgi:hypothetical protein
VGEGETIGSSGVDFLDLSKKIVTGAPFGIGNCYGLILLWNGKGSLPKGVDPWNYGGGWLKGDKKFEGEKSLIPITSNQTEPGLVPWGSGKYYSETYYPGDLFKSLTEGKRETRNPKFGDLCLFWRGSFITHAAIVLGNSRSGEVYILQKVNAFAPYAVTTVNQRYISTFGTPYYYGK